MLANLVGGPHLPGGAVSAVASDIPGDPLPGPVAAGRLGGAIYDVVYRLTVPAGHVIVASVSGTPGTDFDLYLFDQSATTVLSETGLLIKSNGPTSTESISWPSRFGGTYYIDLNGATDVEGDYLLTVQTVPDPTRPSLTLDLQGGRAVTNTLTVDVGLNATDDLSGIAAVALSADGLTFGGWQSYAPTITWTFQPGDGVRRLWAKVLNGVGLESAVVSDSIVVDTVAPRVSSVSPSPGSAVAGLRPTVRVTFDEPIAPASWLELGLILQATSGALIRGSYAYDPATRTGTFVPASSLVAGATYVVTVGNVMDVAGNLVSSPGSWSMIPLTPVTLAVDAQPRVVARGGSAAVSIDLSGAPLPAIVEADISVGGGPFLPGQPVTTDDGSNTLIVAPVANTTYRFRYPGTPTVASTQAEVRVLVRRAVSLVGRNSATVSRATAGRPVSLVAGTTPAASGLSLSFKLYRYDAGRRVWTYAGSRGRTTGSDGRAALSWVPAASGSYYWRVSVASTIDFANNTSAVYRWTVAR